MGTTPLVSVLMPVHNGMPHLPLAVESILKQTFNNFEFVIVDDCSGDYSPEYLKSVKDDRIVLISLSQNKGVTGALQEGMRKVRGKYIARLDADDIAMPDRLQQQVEFLEANNSVGLLGSGYEVIDSDGKFIRHFSVMRTDFLVRWRMLFKNPFVHSTVMFRRDLIEQNKLDYRLKHGEDYQLWVELMQFCKAEISPRELIQYRLHPKSWSFTKSREQIEAGIAISLAQIKTYLSADETKLVELIWWQKGQPIDKEKVREVRSLFLGLLEQFTRRNLVQVNRAFVRQNLRWLRRRIGFFAYFRFDLVRIYQLLFQIRDSAAGETVYKGGIGNDK